MKFLRSEVDRKFEAFSILLYRQECWEYVFLPMWWANQDNTKTHDFFNANTKDFQPNNHLAIFKNSQSCTSLNKHIILEQKNTSFIVSMLFFVGVFSPTWCFQKSVFSYRQGAQLWVCQDLFSETPIALAHPGDQRNGSRDETRHVDIWCMCSVCSKFKLQQIPGEKIIYIFWCCFIPIGSMYGIFTYIYHKNQPFM